MAIGHPNLIDKSTFRQQVIDFIEQKAPEIGQGTQSGHGGIGDQLADNVNLF